MEGYASYQQYFFRRVLREKTEKKFEVSKFLLKSFKISGKYFLKNSVLYRLKKNTYF